MKHFESFLLLSVAAIGAWAQPVSPGPPGPLAGLTPESRRAELRAALNSLQAQQAPPTGAGAQADAPSLRKLYDRHLSAQQRADLREQLRLQRGEGVVVPGANARSD